MLRFKRETIALPIHAPGCAGLRAIEKVSAVKLESWFRGIATQDSPRARIVRASGKRRARAGFAIEHPVMIVPVSNQNLCILLTDTCPNRR